MSREKAPAELLLDLVFLRSELDLFLAVIGSKEDDLTRFRLHTRLIQKRLERDARPLAVRAETLKRATIAGALEPGRRARRRPSAGDRRARRTRLVYKSGDLQAIRRWIDLGMAVVLGREELVRGVNAPSILRTSMMRRSASVTVTTFSGMSVKGTSVAPSAMAGIAQSGTPRRLNPATAKLPFRISRRVFCVVVMSGTPHSSLLRCQPQKPSARKHVDRTIRSLSDFADALFEVRQ